MLITRLILVVDKSRGIFAGPDAPDDESTTGLVEFKQRDTEDFGVPVMLQTGTIEMNVPGHFDVSGHVFVRQVDPIPLSILNIIPVGSIP